MKIPRAIVGVVMLAAGAAACGAASDGASAATGTQGTVYSIAVSGAS